MGKSKHKQMDIGQGIKAVRKNLDLTQEDFAELIGITQSYLSLIEKGNKKPHTTVLEAIAEKANTPMAVLMWMGLTEADVKPDKVELFKTLKPSIDSLVNSIFLDKQTN